MRRVILAVAFAALACNNNQPTETPLVRAQSNSAITMPQPIVTAQQNAMEATPFRDVFRYAERAAPAAKSERREEPKAVAAAIPTPQPEPARAAVAAPPSFSYSYLGTFGPNDRPFAVFSHAGDVVTARVGESIAGSEFFVREIGIESITVALRSDPSSSAQRIAIGLH